MFVFSELVGWWAGETVGMGTRGWGFGDGDWGFWRGRWMWRIMMIDSRRSIQ